MYCKKCGGQNSDDAAFCQKCGSVLDDEEETRISGKVREPGEEDGEERIFSIRPTLMFVKLGYVLAVGGAFLLVILLNFIGTRIGIDVPYFVSVPAGLALLLIPAFFHLRQKMKLYTLTESTLEIDEGLISKTTRNVPLRIIQDVTVSATIFQRLIGFGNVEIENANENDPGIVLRNINTPKKYAEMVLKQMRRLHR